MQCSPRCVLILTAVVPKQLPIQTAMAVNTASWLGRACAPLGIFPILCLALTVLHICRIPIHGTLMLLLPRIRCSQSVLQDEMAQMLSDAFSKVA